MSVPTGHVWPRRCVTQRITDRGRSCSWSLSHKPRFSGIREQNLVSQLCGFDAAKWERQAPLPTGCHTLIACEQAAHAVTSVHTSCTHSLRDSTAAAACTLEPGWGRQADTGLRAPLCTTSPQTPLYPASPRRRAVLHGRFPTQLRDRHWAPRETRVPYTSADRTPCLSSPVTRKPGRGRGRLCHFLVPAPCQCKRHLRDIQPGTTLLVSLCLSPHRVTQLSCGSTTGGTLVSYSRDINCVCDITQTMEPHGLRHKFYLQDSPHGTRAPSRPLCPRCPEVQPSPHRPGVRMKAHSCPGKGAQKLALGFGVFACGQGAEASPVPLRV